MRLKLLISVILVVLATGLLIAQRIEPVSGNNGMVATAHPLATKAAIKILKMNGNAIDAAVAAAFAIGVVEPDGSGIGGGGGMVVYLKEENQSYYINYYVKSSAESPKRFETSKSKHTGASICIPGTIAGLTLAHEKFGSLPLSDVLSPAIELANEGFPIDATLGALILDHSEMLGKDPATAAVYLDDGFPKMEGDVLIQKDLAQTLQAVSEKGKSGFYKGAVAQKLVEGIRQRGGTITLKDLDNYEARILKPLQGTYRDYDIVSACMPQSGVSVIQGLQMLEYARLREMGHYTQNSTTLHVIAETFRKIYTDRYYTVGDPDFVDPPVNGLLSKGYAKERFDAINQFYPDPKSYRQTEMGTPGKYEYQGQTKVSKKEKKRFEFGDEDDDFSVSGGEAYDEFDSWGKTKSEFTKNDSLYLVKPRSKRMKKEDSDALIEDVEYDGSTTHLSVVDKQGNAVSLTQTLGTFFGSGQTVNGVLLNCGMTNFSSTDNPNILKKNKQPRSSIAPTIIFKDGHPFLIVGTPGGSRIIATIIQVIVNVIDFDMNVEEANRAPRFYTQKWEDNLHVESGVGQTVIGELEKMGHSLMVHEGLDLFFGGVQMIQIDPGTGLYYGSADTRRGGMAKGY